MKKHQFSYNPDVLELFLDVALIQLVQIIIKGFCGFFFFLSSQSIRLNTNGKNPIDLWDDLWAEFVHTLSYTKMSWEKYG